MEQRLVKYNRNTGEILEEFLGSGSIIPDKRKKARGFSLVFIEEFDKLKQRLYRKGYYASALLVDYFIVRVDSDTGQVQFNAAQFAEYAGCTTKTAYDALNKLKNLETDTGVPEGVIRLVKEYGALKIFELSPYVAWRGLESQRQNVIHQKNRKDS